MRNKTDKRTIRTKKAIKEAFAQLYLEKPIEEINVIDISNGANISRKTFYYYYQGIWQLMEEIENDMTDDIIRCIAACDIRRAVLDPSIIFNPIFNFLKEQQAFYWKIIRSEHKTRIWEKGFAMMKQKVYETFADSVKIGKSELSVIIDFNLSGLFDAYKNWMNSDDPDKLKPEQMSKLLAHLIIDGIKEFVIPENVKDLTEGK